MSISINNRNYDYWEGSFKGYSPEKLLALSNKDFYNFSLCDILESVVF